MKHNNQLKTWRLALTTSLIRCTQCKCFCVNFSQKKQLPQQGITLIELLIVMFLVGILAIPNIRSWHDYQQRIKLEVSAQQMLAFLTQLQSEANRHNREVSLWVKRYPSWCIGRNGLAQTCDSQITGIFAPPYADIMLSDFNNIKFYGLRNTAMPGHLTLSNSSGRVRVVLSGRGRLRLCSENRRLMGIPQCQ